jgi:hypothetical protein
VRKKIRISFSLDELEVLQDIIWHFTDFMINDNRPDRGLGKLKEYCYLPGHERLLINMLAVKLKLAFSKKRKKLWEQKQIRPSLTADLKRA